ncbi:SpaA isopeptide-forming pilin-related protein [Pseudoflavonifractor sp. An184]|uniref:SpaA isopeptide-forming pilin-related protein n=1 Tax=Pseudoflavonifractor sp. An184 TaxID=1965576 RepID=UPI001FA91026|nr:SpaA isopeptide-forming pilin-related protein [Pseudoflavonifractor sp. An184]
MLKHLKHHWKRTVSGLMALVMAAGMLPVNGLAAEVPEPAAKTQAEAAYAPTGNFELAPAGTTAWNGGEEPMTVYSSQAGTTQEAEIPAGEPFALLEDGDSRLKIGYSEGGWTGGTLEDTGWVDKDGILVNLPDLIPSIAYVREDAEKIFNSRLTRFEYVIPCPYGEAERLAQLQEEAMEGGETLLVRMEGQTVTVSRATGDPASLKTYSLDGETYRKYEKWTESAPADSGISAYQVPYEISTVYSADPSFTLGMFAPQTSKPNRAPSNVTPTGDVGAYNPGSPGGQKPHTSNVAWAIDPERTFLRFTLVEFPGGVVTDLNTMDWNTWHVVGTPLNVVWSNGWSADQCRSDVTWYNSSAMHYNAMGANAPQLMAGSSVSNGVYSYDATVGYNQRWVTTADEFQSETGITNEQKEQMFHLNSDSWSTGWLNGDYTSMWGTDAQSVTPGNLYQVYEANDAFLYLLGRLTETDNHSGGSNPGWSEDEAMEKWSEYVKDKDGNLRTKYRIIVETGMILRDPDGGRRAYTLRDMMAYSLYNNEASQQYNLIWDQSSTTVNMAQWMRQAKEQFLEYPLDENGTPTGEELVSTNGFAECDSYVDTIQYARPIRDTIFSEQRSFGLHIFSPFNFEHDTPDEPDPDPDPAPEPEPEPDPGPGTSIKITKLEEGTTLGLEGAVFKITAPDGSTVGSTYTTGSDGTVTVQLNQTGHFTVEELTPPKWYLKGENSTQHVNVTAGQMAELTFTNKPYGNLRVEKYSDTGELLEGVTIQIKNLETGETQSGQTGPDGSIEFTELAPGGYEVREISGIPGWQADVETVKTATVVSGETSTAYFINQELPGLRITKYDRTSKELLSDIIFSIWRDGEYLGDYETDSSGEILLTDCQPGTYRVEEKQSDDAHITITTPQELELKAGDGIKELVFFNDLKPGIHLTKVDSADLSKPIANARFRIEAVDGSWGPEEYTTSEDGTIDLSKLPVGAYVVTELECPGYVIDDAQRIIHLDPNENAEFVFTNSKLPSLTLTKTSSDGTPLAGVTFRLAKVEDGGHYLDRTTGPDGTITWEGLEPGSYSLVETATVSDHILDAREHHIQLFPGRDSTIDLENDRRPNLTVVKRDADSGAPIADTVFLVEAADGHSVDEIKTGPDGKAVLENLLPGVYEISEKSVPSPYLMDAEPQLVTLYPNRDHTAYFENHKAPTIEIIKENSITHERLSNVRFQVWYASNDTETGEYNDLGVFTTDENGRIELTGPDNGLRDGWFRVKELEPPAGFSIKDSDTQEAFVQAGKGHTFLFENTPLSALVVYKRDSVTGAALPNCRFQLSYLGGSTSGTGGTVIGTYVTSENGSFTVTGLKAGYYICEELESDGAHVIDSAPQSFYISGEDQDIVTLYFGNAPKGAVLVKKVSASDNSPLSDVEFFVTTADGAVVGDANGKFVTDSAGSFLVEGVEPGTTLVIKETRAKPGYLLDNTPQTVQVKEGQTVTVEFRNQPLGNLVIEKWGRNGTSTVPLEGVKFEVKYANGQYVDAAGGTLSSNGLYYTDSTGKITLSGLTGTVIVTELESVEGYTIDPDSQSQTVTINPNDTQTLRFYNDAVGGAELTKVSEADKSETIPDVTFEIRRVSDDALVDTVTTGRNGKVYISLEAGNYYAVETDCPDTFRLDPTPVYFTVEKNRTTPLTVTNAPISGILLHKISTADGDGIPGVSFILHDSSHNPIDQQTTDDRGYAWFEGLTESGRYYLRELENEGYIPDTQLRTVYVKAGETTLVEWENTPITGQIQIIKRSADYNPTTGLPAGTLLEGAVFEIYDKAGNAVDTIRSDSRGLAVSKQLPLSRYTIREVKSPDHYGVNEEVLTAYLEYEGQILRFEVTNKSLSTGVSISKTGPKEVVSGQPVRYTFSGIANTSNVRLDSFYWRDTLPAQVRLEQVVTGTYNFPGTYKIVYKVNGTGDYRTLADNLSTSQNYTLAASSVALGLAANERVTEIMFVFGQAPAGFAQVEAPVVHCTAINGLAAGSSFVNVADVGGVYNGQWVQAVTRWVTTVYGKPEPLPRTGY